MLRKLLKDDSGFVVSSELILLSVVALIGTIAGVSTLRTSVMFELADVSTAIGDLNHSYSFAGATTSAGSVNGSSFIDRSDFCTPRFTDNDPPREPSGCISVLNSSTPE